MSELCQAARPVAALAAVAPGLPFPAPHAGDQECPSGLWRINLPVEGPALPPRQALAAGSAVFHAASHRPHPHHHCPFCPLKSEYDYRGYWPYVPLFAAVAILMIVNFNLMLMEG